MTNNQDPFKKLDELLNEKLDGEKINEKVSEVSNQVNDNLTNSAKEKGYDDFWDMLSGEIGNAFSNKKFQAPKIPISSYSGKYESRYDYFIALINSVNYEGRFKGFYREGHIAAIDKYVDLALKNQDNLAVLDEEVELEILSIRKMRRSRKYEEGYYAGLMYVKEALLKSKNDKMKELNDQLSRSLKNGKW